jgi:hypothetical protein
MTMNNGLSLEQYIAQANRGNNFGGALGAEFLQKQTYLGVDTSSSSISGDIFTTTFGRKVWQALNNQTRFFNAIPRTVWGTTAGWRVRTDRGTGRSRRTSLRCPAYQELLVPPSVQPFRVPS